MEQIHLEFIGVESSMSLAHAIVKSKRTIPALYPSWSHSSFPWIMVNMNSMVRPKNYELHDASKSENVSTNWLWNIFSLLLKYDLSSWEVSNSVVIIIRLNS